MEFHIHSIQNKALRPLISYILFNFSKEQADRSIVTSFANTNICLGVMRGKRIISSEDDSKETARYDGISSYISGMYLQPHRFKNMGTLDEICIDFTPLGYYHFFQIPQKKYILGGNVLKEAFGEHGVGFFERVFEENCFSKRGLEIERFFCSKMRNFCQPLLSESLQQIYNKKGQLSIQELSALLKVSEKRLLRTFKNYFDLTPKSFSRIVKFRYALQMLNSTAEMSLTQIGYAGNYYDQSHFIKEFRFFTGQCPKAIQLKSQKIQNQVFIAIDSSSITESPDIG